MNMNGYESFDEVMKHGMMALSVDEFATTAQESDALILDTRDASEFSKGFIPRSINIGLTGDFAPWVGALIVDVKQPILLVTDAVKEQETITRLSRVGFDALLGHLKGGFESWKQAGKEVDTVNRISAAQFEEEVQMGTPWVIDIRKASEYENGHLTFAENKPLSSINTWINELGDQPFYLHCAGGYRSMIAASILQSRGYRNFKEVEGGYTMIRNTSLPETLFVQEIKVLAD
jgi:rhodanese-related sulfurtransferase